MARVLIPLGEGFEEIEAVTVIDILRRGGVEVTVAAMGDALEVAGAHGVTMRADRSFKAAEQETYDCILLPGGPGTQHLRESEALKSRLRAQKEQGGLLAAICAAPLVLVDAGVLNEQQHITCYPTCVMDLDRRAANAPVVEDGNVITGQAPGAAMLFALVVLKALCGEPIAQRIARGLVTDLM